MNNKQIITKLIPKQLIGFPRIFAIVPFVLLLAFFHFHSLAGSGAIQLVIMHHIPPNQILRIIHQKENIINCHAKRDERNGAKNGNVHIHRTQLTSANFEGGPRETTRGRYV